MHAQLQAAGAQNTKQLAAALRGVQLLQGSSGADPKLVAMSQTHMLGEVLSALFERLHARDNAQASGDATTAGGHGGHTPATPKGMQPD